MHFNVKTSGLSVLAATWETFRNTHFLSTRKTCERGAACLRHGARTGGFNRVKPIKMIYSLWRDLTHYPISLSGAVRGLHIEGSAGGWRRGKVMTGTERSKMWLSAWEPLISVSAAQGSDCRQPTARLQRRAHSEGRDETEYAFTRSRADPSLVSQNGSEHAERERHLLATAPTALFLLKPVRFTPLHSRLKKSDGRQVFVFSTVTTQRGVGQ